jgi:murein DD-endopeptidase MepM/ murein hydrolase activator NlpD
MQRAGDGDKAPATEKIPGRIDNTSLTSDLNRNVNETFVLTPGSTDTAATWRITTNGRVSVAPPGLNFNTSTGALTGQVPEADANRLYKVEIEAFRADSTLIDSREFNFFPKTESKDETIKFVWPLSPKGTVTSGFGPRKLKSPAGASGDHKGMDIANPRGKPGTILSAADGTVTFAGPMSGYGNAVFIEHRDSKGTLVATTVYGHMSDIYVKKGQKVSAGQNIAKEGSVGVSSGNHLHFEIRKGGTTPVDPTAYLNGTYNVPKNTSPIDGSPTGGEKHVNRENAGMTTAEASVGRGSGGGDCPQELQNQLGGGQNNVVISNMPVPSPTTSTPSQAETKAIIARVLDDDPSLTQKDKEILQMMAKIESDYKADAKNPNSSARGVYQMLDKTAAKYYNKIGIPPTEENRNNPEYATKAQIEFYKSEQKRYWDEFQSSMVGGQPTIAGKKLDPSVSARYANLSQGEFIYGLIHHDGVGNAVRGNDLQGVEYWRRKVTGAG